MHTTYIERGIVSSRVALLLRSAEIKPLFSDLFFEHFSEVSIVEGKRSGERGGGTGRSSKSIVGVGRGFEVGVG